MVLETKIVKQRRCKRMNGHGHGSEGHDMPDPEKIKEILNIVAEKVPGLLKELTNVLYGPDQAKNFGIAMATFYKELKTAGMSDEEAFELTRQYMSTLNMGQWMGKFKNHGCYEQNEHD